MHAYEIEDSIKNAVNAFALQMGWINEPWRVHSIRPSGEDSLIDDEEVVKLISASIGSYVFDFLAIVHSPSECILYMDARTANMVMEFKIRNLGVDITQRLKDHLTIYPHNMGV